MRSGEADSPLVRAEAGKDAIADGFSGRIRLARNMERIFGSGRGHDGSILGVGLRRRGLR